MAHSLLPDMLREHRAPVLIRAAGAQPQMPYGVAAGDLLRDRAIVWSRTDRPARMIVEYDTRESLQNARKIVGPAALDNTDFTARLDLTDLPADQDIFYRVSFQDLTDLSVTSEPTTGRFHTPPVTQRDVSFLWSGDEAGQGWGINPDWGGMRIFKSMADLEPDFFVHSGDTIYADVPLKAEVKLPDGTIWKNIVTEAKSKVAESLAEYRGNFAYNYMDANVRNFNASVLLMMQWDDHDVLNNWYPTKSMKNDTNDALYQVKSVALLASYAKRAFFEYYPLRYNADEMERIYRVIPYGPSLDVFMLDKRSYRGANNPNTQPKRGPDADFIGPTQLLWLKRALLASNATWKVIASDMPIGLVVPDPTEKKPNFEAWANGDDGAPSGRELELAEILSFIKHNDIPNVVWITADVHYTAALRYDPNKATFQDFNPFYKFVSGPLNAGTFGPNKLDGTFGPQLVYQKAPDAGQANLPPSAGMQFFGQIQIAGDSELMTVTLRDLEGKSLFIQEIQPE